MIPLLVIMMTKIIPQKSKKFVLQIFIFLAPLLSLLMILLKISKTFPERQFRATDLLETRDRHRLPLCENNLLDRRSFHHPNQEHLTFNYKTLEARRLLVVPKAQCDLFDYTPEHVSTCLDVLHLKLTVEKKTAGKKMLHFAFVGDSRIRQQFYNFIKLIPEYDRRVYPNPIPTYHHNLIHVNSSLLNLRVTFHWHSHADGQAITTIRQWITNNRVDPPHFVLLSMAAHHMLADIGADGALKLYQKELSEFSPSLAQLANVSQVVWLNQYPTVDFYGEMGNHNTAIHAGKVHHYNQAIRRIFQNHSSIRLWDSSNSLAEEYVRGCVLSPHRTSVTREKCDDLLCDDNRKIHETSYSDCKDYIHTGYVALSQATQILLNAICNKYA